MARRDDRDSGRSRSSRDLVRDRARETKFTGGSTYIKLPDGVTFFKPKKGTMDMDIVQYEVTEDMVIPISLSKDMTVPKGTLLDKRTIFVHRKIGADERSYLCPRTIKQPCPICEERAHLQKSGANEDLVKDLKPQVKELYNVDGGKEGMQLFEYSYANFGKKLDEEINEGREDWAGYADLEGGYTLGVRFSEESFAGTKYLEATRIDFEPRSDYKESILEETVNLDDCLDVLPYEELDKIFQQLGGEESRGRGKDRDDDRGRGKDKDRGDRDDRGKGRDRDDDKDRGRGRDRDRDKDDDDKDKGRGRDRDRGRDKDDDDKDKGRDRDRGRGRDKEDDSDKGKDRDRERGRERDDKEEPPTRERSTRTKGGKDKDDDDKDKGRGRDKDKDKGGDDDCPHGYTFGKDCDEEKECAKCKVWDDCRDEKDRLKKSKK